MESPIKLSWWENDITLQWSALDFGTDRHVEYAYKLEGVDNDWIYAGFSNSVTYANLHGGDYTFRVRTRSGHSDWNETALRCDIIVRTAWFRSWWFFALVAFIAIGSLFALYRFRLRQLMKVQAVRNRLAGDLHDEVGSNLSSLVIYSDLVIAGAERGKVDVNIVQKMKDTSSQSLESMRDIV
ncbi:MAG: hypothetical protein JNM00_02785, partial [Flavobacteriales bacterium]|nr:hypothetical protein [Flavobacteriales bacterium]